MGSVTGVVDGSGSLTGSAEWDAFGELRSGNVSSAVAGGGFGLHGMWLDEGTGLHYVRARTYDARTGRFWSRDPVAGVTGRPETMNPYVFVNGNPVIYVDPTGGFSLGELSTVTAVVGVLSAIAMPSVATYLKTASIEKTGTLIGAGGAQAAFARSRLLSDLQRRGCIEYAALEQLARAIQRTVNPLGGTAGVGFGANAGLVKGVGVSVYVATDSTGRSRLAITVGGGAALGGSIGVEASVTDAISLEQLRGFGFSWGGSGPISAELNWGEGFKVFGTTVGVGPGAEAHTHLTYTWLVDFKGIAGCEP